MNPIGALAEHRGGLGKVLLFNAIMQLKEWNFNRAYIPTTANLYTFYNKAGFMIDRILVKLRKNCR